MLSALNFFDKIKKTYNSILNMNNSNNVRYAKLRKKKTWHLSFQLNHCATSDGSLQANLNIALYYLVSNLRKQTRYIPQSKPR